MRTPLLLALLAVSSTLILAPASAAPGDAPVAPARGEVFRSDRFGLAVMGPSGWTKEIAEAKASGTWIDLVSYREPKTKAFLKVSCQASTYADFAEMKQKLTAYYGGLADITLMGAPSVMPAVMGLRDQGLYVEFARTVGKRSDRSFLAFYLNGRFTVRLYGTVTLKQWAKAEPTFSSFLRSLRVTSRTAGTGAEPNFVLERDRCGFVIPDGLTIRILEKGGVAQFTSQRLGVTIWLYREARRGDLASYSRSRVEGLEEAGAREVKAIDPVAHATTGNPLLVVDFVQGVGPKTRRYREICLSRGDQMYRFVLAGTQSSFAKGVPVLEKMVETIRFF